MRKIKPYIEFLFRKDVTVRFKIMNLISGDELRKSMTSVHEHMEQFRVFYREENQISANYHAFIARMIINYQWNNYFREIGERK